MTRARLYQIAGNTTIIIGGFVFVAIIVLASTHPIPDWVRSTMLATAILGMIGGLIVRGHGGLQLVLDEARWTRAALAAAPTIQLPTREQLTDASRRGTLAALNEVAAYHRSPPSSDGVIDLDDVRLLRRLQDRINGTDRSDN